MANGAEICPTQDDVNISTTDTVGMPSDEFFLKRTRSLDFTVIGKHTDVFIVHYRIASPTPFPPQQ